MKFLLFKQKCELAISDNLSLIEQIGPLLLFSGFIMVLHVLEMTHQLCIALLTRDPKFAKLYFLLGLGLCIFICAVLWWPSTERVAIHSFPVIFLNMISE